MEDIFDQFLKDKTYIRNVPPRTISFYRQSFAPFRRSQAGEPGGVTRAVLNNFVISLRERGMTSNGASVYIRGMNSFLFRCFQNGLTGEELAAPDGGIISLKDGGLKFSMD